MKVLQLTSTDSKRDKFADILPQKHSYDASMVAEQIRANMEQVVSPNGAMWDTSLQCDDSALCYTKRWDNRNRVHSTGVTSNILPLGKELRGKRGISYAINILVAILYTLDRYTYGHSIRTSNHALAIGEAIGFSPERLFILHTAALLHDIGKIFILSEVLNETTPLTEEEWKIVHTHPTLGVSILLSIDGLARYLSGIRHHHERYDGTGYPSGLKGHHIPLDARIIGIADAYDAMTSPRCYRERTLIFNESAEELKHNMGMQFDPQLVGVFITLMRQTSRMPVEIKYAE